MSGTARATVDNAGRLVAADPALEALNSRAGGAIGAPLAVPPLAGIVRLVRRLGVVVSRPVTVADEDADINLWVRAQPEGEDILLAVSGWRAQRPWPGTGDTAPSLMASNEWRWETDSALRLTHVALDAGERQGLKAADLLGQPLTALFMLEPNKAGGSPLVEALARREPLRGQRVRLKANARAANLHAEIRRDGGGGFVGFSGTVVLDEQPEHDPLPPLAAAFTQGLDQALRRPLTRIVAHADSISAGAEGPIARDYADYAADIAGAGRHLLALVDDLVDLQAIEGPDFTLEAESIDLADLARRAAGLLSVRAQDAGVVVDRPDTAATAPARGDFRRVLQILVNVIGNAVRYAPRGSRVTFSLDEMTTMRTVTVADTGKGIAPEDAERVFGKFERVDPAEPGGSGLGLYISRRLARAMGGDLLLDSEPGEGARFTLALPAD